MLVNALFFVMLRLEREDAFAQLFVLLEQGFVAVHDLLDFGRVRRIRAKIEAHVVDLTSHV